MREVSICPIWHMGAPYAIWGSPVCIWEAHMGIFIWTVPYVYELNICIWVRTSIYWNKESYTFKNIYILKQGIVHLYFTETAIDSCGYYPMFTFLAKQNLDSILYGILWQPDTSILLLMRGWLQSIYGIKLCIEKFLCKVDLIICQFIPHYNTYLPHQIFLRWGAN